MVVDQLLIQKYKDYMTRLYVHKRLSTFSGVTVASDELFPLLHSCVLVTHFVTVLD